MTRVVTPAVTAVRMSGAAHRAELPLLVLGPALGTSASTLWGACVTGLSDVFDVLAWDLPGHGHNRAVPDEPGTMADLARGVLAVVDDVCEQRGKAGSTFLYAGDSVGGAVGLQLLLDAPNRVGGAVLLCTGAKLGEPAAWAERTAQVRASGTAALVAGSSERWFGPGFLEREPERCAALLGALRATVDGGYAAVCGALAGFDVRDRLGEIAAPVLAVAGAADTATPPALLQEIATGVRDGRLVVLDGVAHLAPAEAPEEVAALLRQHLLGEAPPVASEPVPPVASEPVPLGVSEPDVAAFRRDFQELVADHAWNGPPTRPGLDPRSRSLVTLTALVAGGHHEELATQVRVALGHGLDAGELRELLLQTAVHCGLPTATAALRVVQGVLAEQRS